jgi:HAMP domain-containing protein
MKENVDIAVGYWPDGTKKYESPLLNGVPHGTVRSWYSNGQLEKEVDYKFGKPVKNWTHWTADGALLGHFDLTSPNKVSIDLNYDGSVDVIWIHNTDGSLSIYFIRDKIDGVFFEYFNIHGRKVSKLGYLKACEFDPTLPRYEGDPNAIPRSEVVLQQELDDWRMRQATLQAKGENTKRELLPPEYIEKMLASPTTFEAKSWLEEPTDEMRDLRKVDYNDASRLIVEEGYAAGCLQIFAINLKRFDHQVTADTLLVKIPAEGEKRKTALEWVLRTISGNSFLPDDVGQQWFEIFFD